MCFQDPYDDAKFAPPGKMDTGNPWIIGKHVHVLCVLCTIRIPLVAFVQLLQLCHLEVLPAKLHQIIVCTALYNTTVIEDQNLIGINYSLQSMSNSDGYSARHRVLEGLLDQLFGRGIQRRGRFIQ